MDYFDPYTLDEAFSLLSKHGDDATLLAGGTDVVVALLRGEITSSALVHIRRIPDIHGLTINDRTLIGTATTHWQLATHEQVAREHAAIVDAALTVGGRQTQNVGTVGGNIVNASPAADLVPALLVSEARVTLASHYGTRELPLETFITGRKTTARLPHELLSQVSLERPPPRTGEAYVKLGRRSAMEVAVVGLAARVSRAADGTIDTARLAVCSVGPKAIRLHDAEQLLVGAHDHQERLDDVGAAAEAVVAPIDDVRSSADYRRRVLTHLIDKALTLSHERTARRGT